MEVVVYKGAIMQEVQKCDIQIENEFTPTYRWLHWIRAFSILVLVITGFYIAKPFLATTPNPLPTTFTQAILRSWHEILGFLLTAVILFKTYLFFFGKKYKKELGSIKDFLNPKIWVQQIGYYLLISKHPKLQGTYNPLQFGAYIGFYILMFILILTGLILYVHVYHNGLGGMLYDMLRSVEVWFGGLANVRELHHIAMWGVILFVSVHIYMAIYNAVFQKNCSMGAIFSGIKIHKKH